MTYIKGIPHRRPSSKSQLILDLQDEFIFGSHRNRTVDWVLCNHPSYIDWFTRQGRLAGVRFTSAVLERLAVETAKPDYNPDLTPYDVYVARHGKFVPPR